MLRAIDIVTIPVRDQDAALRFYTEKLGFKVVTNQYFGNGKQRWILRLIPGAESRIGFSFQRVLRTEWAVSNQ